jgi:hypothetical protein
MAERVSMETIESKPQDRRKVVRSREYLREVKVKGWKQKANNKEN